MSSSRTSCQERVLYVVFGVRCKRQMIHFETPKGRRLIYTHKLCLQFLTDVVYSFVSQVMNVVRSVAFTTTKAVLDKKQTYSWRNAILIKSPKGGWRHVEWSGKKTRTFLKIKKQKDIFNLEWRRQTFSVRYQWIQHQSGIIFILYFYLRT